MSSKLQINGTYCPKGTGIFLLRLPVVLIADFRFGGSIFLLWRGPSGYFEIDDLYDLDDFLSSGPLAAKFQERWRLDNKTHKYSLLIAV